MSLLSHMLLSSQARAELRDALKKDDDIADSDDNSEDGN